MADPKLNSALTSLWRPMQSTEVKSLQGEFAAWPEVVVVHDPVRNHGFDIFNRTKDDTIQSVCLFRERPNESLFTAQHKIFVDTLKRYVKVIYTDELLTVDELANARENPNQVYTRDSIITVPWLPGHFIPGNMLEPIRRSEQRVMQAVATRLGRSALFSLPEDCFLEGGDVIPFVHNNRRILFIGYGRRTQWKSVLALHELMVPRFVDEIMAIELAPWRINLDGGMVPVAANLVIAHPESLLQCHILDSQGIAKCDLLQFLGEIGMNMIEVTREESKARQACNCFCIGDRQVICYDLCPRVLQILQQQNVRCVTVPGSELVKGTGGPRCMTRPFYA